MGHLKITWRGNKIGLVMLNERYTLFFFIVICAFSIPIFLFRDDFVSKLYICLLIIVGSKGLANYLSRQIG